MKQMVILSGKGGTGKTSLTAAFSALFAADNQAENCMVLVDADVDASNLELILHPQQLHSSFFFGGETAVIDQYRCTGCGICLKTCRFEAVLHQDETWKIDPFACEGCAACFYQCPEQAIRMEEQTAGEWYRSDSKFGALFHAHLYPGQENSGKLVAQVKDEAHNFAEKNKASFLLVDGPPGIGCPVISALSGADLALMVAEPSLAGIHDLERILSTAAHFEIQTAVAINKADVFREGSDRIKEICRKKRIPILGEVPFDLQVAEAMVAGQAVTNFNPDAPSSQAIRSLWKRLLEMMDSISEG